MAALILCKCGNRYPRGGKCSCGGSVTGAARYPHLYKRTRWIKCSRLFRDQFPLCVQCERPSQLVDHIRPHNGNEKLFWDERNWQAMCHRCHNQKTWRDTGGVSNCG